MILQNWQEVNQADLTEVATVIAEHLQQVPFAVFLGEMGAGKTTLVRTICTALGVSDAVASPTYSLVNTYTGPSKMTVHHMDLYRIEHDRELLDSGIVEIFYDQAIVLVEWPQIAADYLPEQYLIVQITATSPTSRSIQLTLHA